MKISHVNLNTLPSLKGLRGFEAAARLLSFTAAAQELSVTQTAISHQVKTLESQLDVKLFHRSGKSIALTDAGQKLLAEASASFQRLANVVRQIRMENQSNVVTVSVTPSFASKWLIQRLGKFWGAHPEIQLNIHHTLEFASFTSDGVDIAVRGGEGNWPGSVTKLPLSLGQSPICHPSMLQGKHPLKSAADLIHHNLLHEDNYDDWTAWLQAAGATEVDPKSGSVMNDSTSLGIAVEACQGVALGRMALIESDLKLGKIAKPFDIEIPSNFAYYLVCPAENLERPGVRAFHDFILEEA